MRSINRQRNKRRQLLQGFDNETLFEISKKVSYVGSPEHKDWRNPLIDPQSPRLRSDASACPREITDRNAVTEWLRSAILSGQIGSPVEGEFPRYVWYRHNDTLYEGRLVNKESGQYKGYPLGEDEGPQNI